MKIESLKVLEGSALASAEDVYNALVPAMTTRYMRRTPNLPIPGRPIHRFGGLSGMEDDHVGAIVEGARALGEARARVCSTVFDIQVGPKEWRGRFGAFEVDLSELQEFCQSGNFRSVKSGGEWVTPEFEEWSKEERELADPVFADGWALMSLYGRWAFASFHCEDDCALAGESALLEAYRSERPDAIYDPIIWMHGEGSHLIDEPTAPRQSWIDRLFREEQPRAVEQSIPPTLRKHLRKFYPEEATDDLWRFFLDSRRATNLGSLVSWETRETAVLEYLKSRPEVFERCNEIWRDTESC